MIFYQAGVFPGIPGQYAGVTVSLEQDGTVLEEVLPQHLDFEPAPETGTTSGETVPTPE